MSTTHGTVKIGCSVDHFPGRNIEPSERYQATVGWVRAWGSSPGYARGELAAKITEGLLEWKRPEIIQHGGRLAVLYTRPDGGAGYDTYNANGAACTSSCTVSPPPGETGVEAEWRAARRSAWHNVVQASVTDWSDGDEVYAGHAALIAAGYSDLAAEHLQYAGWQCAYRDGERIMRRLHPESEWPALADKVHDYASQHATEHIPTPTVVAP
jgi:Fe-S cluster biogenesis protein NfuA